ncbi:MAG: isopentenyl-diphosphate Delta-isomerase, partial [Planctomycetales bacterium]
VGYEEKLAAHQNGGKLHRAFSVFVLNSDGRMLLQQRANSKYHFPGIWTKTCCSHPLRGEVVEESARRRLQFELGIDTDLSEVFSFIYRAEDSASGLVEHELDHVLIGHHDGDPEPNADEVADWKWITVDELDASLAEQPDRYSPWFKFALPRLSEADGGWARAIPGVNSEAGNRSGF